MDNCFKYNYALVSRIANSFDEESCYPVQKKDGQGKPVEIDVDKARTEHEELVECLRRIGVDVIELPSDDKYPDGVYVDDIAVAINGTALICNPKPVKGKPSRAGELAVVRQVLRRELNLKTVDVAPSDKAFLEGGDVLWTGRELFVGICAGRSNELGALAVAKTFPEYPTSLIQLPEGASHLKHYVTMAGPDVMVLSTSDIGKNIFKEMKNTGCHGYKYILVDEDDAANVIYCNDRLIHLDSLHIPNGAGIFANKIANPRVAVSVDETLKRGRPLSSCVLLIHRVKHPKTFPTTTDVNKA